MHTETSVYMMYDIKEDKGVARKLANDYEVPTKVKEEIIDYIENNVDKEKARKKVEEAKYDAALVRIGMARFRTQDNIEFEDRDYKFEGGYKYASGYKI